MESIFISVYHFFRRRRIAFWIVLCAVVALISAGAATLKIEEDITRFFPDDERVEKLNYVFRNSKFAERLVMMVSVADSATAPNPDSLVAYADQLVDSIQAQLPDEINAVISQFDDSKVLEVVDVIQQHLPFFLDSSDYVAIDSMLLPQAINRRMVNSYRQLASPSGMVTKRLIINDPVGISYLALAKLQRLQYDSSVVLYDNFLVSSDGRHLLFFIEPKYKSGETGKNGPLINGIEKIIADTQSQHPQLKASYFGGTAVAYGNARQLQRDTLITVSLTLVLLAVFLLGFFRRKRVPFLILVPVAFGALFALAMVALVQGSISIIAIAGGSIILGIAVNYSLHFLTHLKHVENVEAVIKDLVKPMTIGSTTTVLAFFCLRFVNAAVLQDLGLFAAFSLIGAGLFTLLFLPQMIRQNTFAHHHAAWLEKFASISFDKNKALLWTITLLTPVFLYFAADVSFNTDISQLNFMSDEMRESQARLESINKKSLSAMYVVAQSTTLQNALEQNEHATARLSELKARGMVQKYSSVSEFILSDSLQRVKIDRWNRFWTDSRKLLLLSEVRQQSDVLGFSERVLSNFERLITKPYEVASDTIFSSIRKTFFDDLILEKDGLFTVITMANVDPSKKIDVYADLGAHHISAFDRQMIANLFVEYVHADFNFIVMFTGGLVFLALLLTYGRIELALITFIPMLITWIWILGLMAILGIEFNIVNVMISTFIFGLGDDYSIFTMDGLQQEYQFQRKNLASIRTSILLSALTTISGLGVLIFAEHPALRSIAAISIIGIVCVFFMSQVVEPFLFRWLISRRTSRGLPPMTLLGILKTIFTYTFFTCGSILLTIVGLTLKVIPGLSKQKKYFFHTLIRFFTGSLVRLAPRLRLNYIHRTPSTFSEASVIVCNHASFLDILLTTSFHPRLILLTNKWVWNSPVFGGVVRLADYYPVMEGAEDSISQLEDRVKEGYSVVVFPEGTRSTDGKIGRFHKGAFYMAEKMKLPILPVIIHGAHEGIPKGTIYLNAGQLTVKFLDKINPEDVRFGQTYQERTKAISRHFKQEFESLRAATETPEYFRYKLEANYLYKGPVLEWYMRIKIRLEDFYRPFHEMVPMQGNILDLGCGYGFLPYMLSFLSDRRVITGVDYDEEKIETAAHCFSKSDRVRFIAGDITEFAFGKYDAIIIADVLHYLTPASQKQVIEQSILSLNEGGKLIIRDGNADLKERHKGTKLTEFFSVHLLKFNKSVNALHFLSGEQVRQIAAEHGCSVRTIDDAKFTSNVIFVIEK